MLCGIWLRQHIEVILGNVRCRDEGREIPLYLLHSFVVRALQIRYSSVEDANRSHQHCLLRNISHYQHPATDRRNQRIRKCSLQGDAFVVPVTVGRIHSHLVGGVQKTGNIRHHIRLDARISESKEHRQWQVAIGELEQLASLVSVGVADTGHDRSLEYRSTEMVRCFPTIYRNNPANSCCAIHLVHCQSRWVVHAASYCVYCQ